MGCGAGDVSVRVAGKLPGLMIVGLDLSEPLLGIARAGAEEQGLCGRLEFIRGDAESMPFEDDRFDAVMSLNTLHVLGDPVAMLDEVERVLAPGGLFLLSDIRRSRLGHIMPILKSACPPSEVRSFLDKSDLRRWSLTDRLLYLVVLAGEPLRERSGLPAPGPLGSLRDVREAAVK